jgi:UDP-glucose 4-epimerase
MRESSDDAQAVLIVGAGLIGGHLAAELAGRGHTVTVYSRSLNPWLAVQIAAGLDVSTVRAQVPTAPGTPPATDLRELVEANDVVVMVAGSSTPAFSDADAASSLVGALTPVVGVLDAMRRTTTCRIVLASSGGTVYGRVHAVPTTEEHPTQPTSLHGLHSLTAERYAQFYADVHGLRPTILRFSNIYGPGQQPRGSQGVIAHWCAALAAQRPIALIGDGDVRRDFVHVDDASRALRAAVERDVPGTFNVGAGVSVSLAELLRTLVGVAGVEPQIERLPARSIDVPVTELDCELFAATFGWRPQLSLSDGLVNTWAWYAGPSAPLKR